VIKHAQPSEMTLKQLSLYNYKLYLSWEDKGVKGTSIKRKKSITGVLMRFESYLNVAVMSNGVVSTPKKARN